MKRKSVREQEVKYKLAVSVIFTIFQITDKDDGNNNGSILFRVWMGNEEMRTKVCWSDQNFDRY